MVDAFGKSCELAIIDEMRTGDLASLELSSPLTFTGLVCHWVIEFDFEEYCSMKWRTYLGFHQSPKNVLERTHCHSLY